MGWKSTKQRAAWSSWTVCSTRLIHTWHCNLFLCCTLALCSAQWGSRSENGGR